MDHTSSNGIPAVPPIPRQTRQHARRRSPQRSSSRTDATTAEPEVISSLITSLETLPKPIHTGLDNGFDIAGPSRRGSGRNITPLTQPGSPREGSFGVDYGAFVQPSLHEAEADDGTPLDELAASPPVIRTAPPPSGFSPLTAPPKSPRTSEFGAASGLKSILRSASRPSSKGSVASRDADAVSIGNVSIERGIAPPLASPSGPDLRRQRSQEGWAKKQGRSQRGLMYMSSKERLREKELEKKWASVGAVGGPNGLGSLTSLSGVGSGGIMSSRPDPFLAETAISEEPSTNGDSPTREPSKSSPRRHGERDVPSPRPIPARDSSLRKTGANASKNQRASSTRTRGTAAAASSNKRDSDTAIPELDEQHHPNHHNASGTARDVPRRKHHTSSAAGPSTRTDSLRRSSDVMHELTTPTKATFPSHNHYIEPSGLTATEDETEDSAPFPAVAQGRRRRSRERDRDRLAGTDRRRSNTPDVSDSPNGGVVRVKRSSSKLKRLSGPLSPRPGSPDASHRDGVAGKDVAGSGASQHGGQQQQHVAYERPRSADSIDDAVESYLCSPRLSQKIRHPQTGRVISFSEVGDSEGSAVFCCVGMGLTRYITAFYDELALTLKLRLITPDRPGVGDSEPYADGTATPLSWPGKLRTSFSLPFFFSKVALRPQCRRLAHDGCRDGLYMQLI